MVFGTFDVMHPGHINFLQQAKTMGDRLVVVISRDSTIIFTKKQNVFKEEKRRQALKALNCVDEVVLGGKEDKYEVIRTHKPDVVCLGYDQTYFIDGLQDIIDNELPETIIVRCLSYKPELYKSSRIKQSLT